MAEKVRDYGRLARDIIREAGGKENIANATRCATRLRLVLNETPKDAVEKISAMPGVITVVEKGGQFQVVIGNHVGDVFEVVSKERDSEKGAAKRAGDKAEYTKQDHSDDVRCIRTDRISSGRFRTDTGYPDHY